MKAVFLKSYGSPESVLNIIDAEKPAPKGNEVLIKVKATSINDYDWSLTRGKPIVYRMFFGLLKPRNPIPGMEVSGVIEEIGKDVKSLKVGDEVFGDLSDYGFGSFAEYLAINENAVIKKPSYMSFEQATAIPHASLLAWQGLEKGDLSDGQNILINGAGGGVGTIALQITKMHNCIVTGVDTGEKLNMMRDLGFDYVIDYKKENFSKNGLKYDLILDCKSTKNVWTYLKSLNPQGRYITIGGDVTSLINILLFGFLPSLFSSKKTQILGLKANKGLNHICDLFEKGKLKAVIDGPYPLEQAPQLIRYFGEGKHLGKVVISIDP